MNNRRREVDRIFDLLSNEIRKNRLSILGFLEIFKNCIYRYQIKFEIMDTKFIDTGKPRININQIKEINIEPVNPDFKHIDLRDKENENGIK